jgi:uncharacterized protein (DUF2252 family)
MRSSFFTATRLPRRLEHLGPARELGVNFVTLEPRFGGPSGCPYNVERRVTKEDAMSRATSFALMLLLGVGCGPTLDDPREIEIVNVTITADESLILTRPELAASKYRKMAESPYTFLRGSFPLYMHDLSTNSWDLEPSPHFADVSPYSIGDAHIENFGLLLSGDATLAFEPNDFDAADRHNYLFEVRRLASSLMVGARIARTTRGDEVPDALRPARELARAYAARIDAVAAGGDRTPVELDGAVVANLVSRGSKDLADLAELEELTVIEGERRKLVRGNIDDDDPENVYVDAAPLVAESLPATLARYRLTLDDAPPPEFFVLKDVVREFGSGIASRARVRFIALVEGPSKALDDDVLLEVKELGDSNARSVVIEEVAAATVQERILTATQLCWTRSEAQPLWGTSDLLGFPVQIRLESEAEKSVRVLRLEGQLGTEDALAELGRDVGIALANIHVGTEAIEPGIVVRLRDAIGDADAFAEEQAQVSMTMAERVEADHVLWVHALEALGPTLGLVPTEADRLRGDAAAVVAESSIPELEAAP